MTENQEIVFKKLQYNQLSLLKEWFKKPHIKQWWYLSDDEIEEEYSLKYLEKDTFAYFVYYEDTPIGFIQYYYANRAGEGWWPDEQDDVTVGIDYFIADESFLNKGLGTKILKKFISLVFNNPLNKKIILDVHPDNSRAIHCYEKAGFTFVKQLMTPDGLANQMELHNAY